MIEVIINHVPRGIDSHKKTELGVIYIENVSDEAGELGDYSVRFGVDRNESVGVHQRAIHHFPRTKYNVLGLLKQALETLEPAELEIDGGLPSKVRRKRLLAGSGSRRDRWRSW